tara:strand:+ start:72 stop:1028 length:957 start_codon:yes stop_codon:yes gene_type:complete
MQLAYKPNNEAGKSNPRADLAGNPNIAAMVKSSGGYSRNPLAAVLAKAGMLNRAMDYTNRVKRPEKNKNEPLPKDPEASINPFEADRPDERSEWFSAMQSPFLQMYRKGASAIETFRKKNHLTPEGLREKAKTYLETYKSSYESVYQKVREILTAYGQRSKKEQAESPYSTEKKPEKSESKTGYTIEFAKDSEAIDKPAYEISKAIGNITTTGKYTAINVTYRPSQGAKPFYFRLGGDEEGYFGDIARNAKTGQTIYSRPVEMGNGVVNIMPLLAAKREEEEALKRRNINDIVNLTPAALDKIIKPAANDLDAIVQAA